MAKAWLVHAEENLDLVASTQEIGCLNMGMPDWMMNLLLRLTTWKRTNGKSGLW